MRVVVLHNIVSPHVVPLFERLAQQADVELTVYFLAETDSNRRWDTRIRSAFRSKVLPNFVIRVGRHDVYSYFVNPTVPIELMRDDFDVVISFGWDSFASLVAFAMCRMLRRPFILWSGSTEHEPSWRRTVTLGLVKAIVRGSAACIAYGTRAREYLLRLGARADRIYVAYNTVDVDWFSQRSDELRSDRQQIRDEMGLGGGPVILYVGQLIVRKGAEDLIAAFQSLRRDIPDAELIVVGYGQLEPKLRSQVEGGSLAGIHVVGHVPIAELPRYYVAADVFTLPSREEVWGLVLNEAAASGLPLVSTSVTGATPDLIRDGINGYVVPPGDPARLARALRDALARSAGMGARSRDIVSHMTYNQNVEAVLEALKAATRRKRLTSASGA